MPDHHDTHPSMMVHPVTDRYHCFGCGAHGDVLQLVMSIEGITSLAKAAELLDDHRPLTAHPSGGGPARMASTVERPDLARTPAERVLAANQEAWRYLTLPQLAERGRQYLVDRDLDVTAFEAETGRPAVGHTPWSESGLVDQLRRKGFTDEELVDSGWASRGPNGPIVDRYRRRLIIPVRDDHDRIVGVYGRDTAGTRRAKYLNTPDTAAFNKGQVVYRPCRMALQERARAVVCEGSLDALALAAEASKAGLSKLYAPVSPSGTALTLQQAKEVLKISRRPPLLCADGDTAGVVAAAKWATTFVLMGRESVAVILPNGLDPADWLARSGSAGLTDTPSMGALIRTG
jgi:DNA primase